MQRPLADILRPQSLAEVVGQQHLLGADGVLTKLIAAKHLPSLILWGPPGVGKTTIARLLAEQLDYDFIELSAIGFSTKELQSLQPTTKESKVAKKAGAVGPGLFDATPVKNEVEANPAEESGLVLFIDEIHRLNKSQQAQFLPYVERGDWILVGATTENPSFEIISPLLSRSQVLVLHALNQEELRQIASKALEYLQWQGQLTGDAIDFLIEVSNGDARQLLNFIEATKRYFADTDAQVDRSILKPVLGKLHLVYDKGGEEHYNAISALHKSMRGSDANAAVYYLGRMLEGGEDPLYIVRRCIRFAAEDIGLADPQALILANTAFQATEKIGMPEANVILAELVIYLAKAPKSNAAYKAYGKVRQDIEQFGNLPIPLKIRNAPTQLMQNLDYGKGYKYAHDFTPEELADEKYLPDEIADHQYIE